MSVNVSSHVVITTGGRGFEPEVHGDLKHVFQRLRSDPGFEWNSGTPEQLDVKSRTPLAPISTTDALPVSPTCRLSRSRVVRHGHKLSQSSPISDTAETPSPRITDSIPTREHLEEHASSSSSNRKHPPVGDQKSAVELSASPGSRRKVAVFTEVSPAQRPIPEALNTALQPLSPLTHVQSRHGAVHQQTASASSALETSKRKRVQHPSPTLSQTSFTTAPEEISDEDATPSRALDLHAGRLQARTNDQKIHQAAGNEYMTNSHVSKTPDTEKETSFARFKAAIRAKAKARKSKEWWEYENPASLSRICRAQNVFLPEASNSVNPVETPISRKAVASSPANVTHSIPLPSRPAPRAPVQCERVSSASQPLNLSNPEIEPGETVEGLRELLRVLQEEITGLQQQQSQPTSSTTIAGPSRISVAYTACDVCGDSLPHTFFIDRITSKCSHKTKTCRDCLGQWISTCLESRGWDNINCPECPQLLEVFDVKRSADADLFRRYDELATRAYLSTLPDFRWCTAAGCGSGQLHPESTGPIFKCAACGYRYCVKHNIWHGGETCKEFEYRTGLDGGKKKKEEQASEAKLQKISKKCPGYNCGWRIEKNHGCDHMTCRKCHYEFCWQCMANYGEIRKKGNTAHLKSCKYHSDNIR